MAKQSCTLSPFVWCKVVSHFLSPGDSFAADGSTLLSRIEGVVCARAFLEEV